MAQSLFQERAVLFQPLEPTGSRKTAFWTSVAIHFVLVVTLVLIPLFFTETLKVKFDFIELAPPLIQEKPILEVTYWKQPVPPKVDPKPLVAPRPRKVHLAEPELPKPEPPKFEEVLREKPKPVDPKPIEKIATNFPGPKHESPAAPAPPKPAVRTDVFSTGSSAKPTTNLPAREVQTGGFGDPNGARGPGRPDKVANIPALGSFDLPVGSGAGNGTGGAKGVRAVVASAGFGNGVAIPGSPNGSGGGGGSGRAIQQGGFGDGRAAEPALVTKRRDEGPPQTPVEIEFKPRPDYTEDARKRKIEGEVVLRAQFLANGQIRIMDIIRGLGFGLDENAVRAAQQIRFKPAQRNGQPVDSIAMVRISFQLAY
ncbi:MAG: energy transducer TonB [Acidobacteria bacterium]|nr:energy transducer TonB [Acidobacteriota bacterium]